MELFHKMISGFLGIPERQISSTLHLLGEGATIPFISRLQPNHSRIEPLDG